MLYFKDSIDGDEFESTGIGLTVVKKIVELYNSKVWAESKLGKGSTFFFTLPKQEIESVSTSKNVQTNKETKLCD